MKGYHSMTFTFPADKMVPPHSLWGWYIRDGKVIHCRLSPLTVKTSKRQHRKRSRRWLKEQVRKEVDLYFN